MGVALVTPITLIDVSSSLVAHIAKQQICKQKDQLERLWQVELTHSAAPIIVSDREMVYINDFVDGRDHLVVLDLTTGEELRRVPTPATRATIGQIIVSSAREIS